MRKCSLVNREEVQKSIGEVQHLISKNFRKIMSEKELSYYNVCQKSNISQSTIYNIRDGKCLPSLYTLLRLLVTINVPVSVFFRDCFSGIMPEASEDTRQMVLHTQTEMPVFDVSLVAEPSAEEIYIPVTDTEGSYKFIPVNNLIKDYDPSKNS